MPKNRKNAKKIKIEKKKSIKNIKKNENLEKNELAQAATTCYLTLGKYKGQTLYFKLFLKI